MCIEAPSLGDLQLPTVHGADLIRTNNRRRRALGIDLIPERGLDGIRGNDEPPVSGWPAGEQLVTNERPDLEGFGRVVLAANGATLGSSGSCGPGDGRSLSRMLRIARTTRLPAAK
jgi:hypothetical protein